MPKIVVTDATFPALDQERAVAAKYGASFSEARCTNAAEVVQAAEGADVLVVQFAQVTEEAIARLPVGARIVRYGIGLDNIDLDAAMRANVQVAYVPDYATGEVADHTAALAVALLRKLVPLDRSVRAGRWDAVGVATPLTSFAESTVGFVGYGRIGREVHARLRGFGFQALIADPFVDDTVLAATGAERADLETLFTRANLVCLHVPLTPETKHVVNAERLALMRSDAVIVNTARGGLIDIGALEDALSEKRIGGAGLDVFDEEPLPPGSGLRDLDNVILTPHAAWFSSSAIRKLQSLTADEIERHFTGTPPRCPAPQRGARN